MGDLLEEMRAVASLVDAVLDGAIIELRLEGAASFDTAAETINSLHNAGVSQGITAHSDLADRLADTIALVVAGGVGKGEDMQRGALAGVGDLHGWSERGGKSKTRTFGVRRG